MLWLQLAIILMVAAVQGGKIANGVPAGCEARCAEKAGECVKNSKDCNGDLLPLKCCNCCPKSKGDGETAKGGANQAAKKKPKNEDASNEDGAPKSKSDKGKRVKKVRKDRKKVRKNPKKETGKGSPSESSSPSIKGTKENSGTKNHKKKKNKKTKGEKGIGNKNRKRKKGKGRNGKGKKTGKGGQGKGKKGNGKGDKGKGNKTGKGGKGKGKNGNRKGGKGKNVTGLRNGNKCELRCKDGVTCIEDRMRCDKVKDCGDDDDTDEQGCNFVPNLTCHRCKTWDTGNEGAKYDPDCGKAGYSNHTDTADPSDPYIGCALKKYKNGDVVRLFESWQTNDEMGECYEGTDYKKGGEEYEYTRCWCSENNCNTNLCEECGNK